MPLMVSLFIVSVKQCIIRKDEGDSSSSSCDVMLSEWMPLLLIVPLRLGLNEINPVYFEGLKVNKCINIQYVKVCFQNPLHPYQS